MGHRDEFAEVQRDAAVKPAVRTCNELVRITD